MMRFSIAFQTVVFLQAVVLGIGLGVVYDVLRAIRRLTSHAGVTALCDGIFWMTVLLSGFVFVLTAAQGEGRAYIALGGLLGGSLYAVTCSPLVFGALHALLQCAAKQMREIRAFFVRNVQRLHRAGQARQEKTKKFLKKIVQKILSFFTKKG